MCGRFRHRTSGSSARGWFNSMSSEDHVLAAKAVVLNGIVTDQLVRVPSGPGKPKALREVVQKDIDAASETHAGMLIC